MAVEDWIKTLKLAPKTKANLRGLMHTICQCAVRWEIMDRNPMELVRVKGREQAAENAPRPHAG